MQGNTWRDQDVAYDDVDEQEVIIDSSMGEDAETLH